MKRRPSRTVLCVDVNFVCKELLDDLNVAFPTWNMEQSLVVSIDCIDNNALLDDVADSLEVFAYAGVEELRLEVRENSQCLGS